MVKGITLVTQVAALDRLSALFIALGFEPGKGWEDGTGRGAAFLAPLGNLELVAGRAPAVPPVLVEVTHLDEVRAAVVEWAVADGIVVGEIATTHWNSRLFTVALDKSLTIGFWESENPLHGRPVAIEGDLSAVGMRFAIVVARCDHRSPAAGFARCVVSLGRGEERCRDRSCAGRVGDSVGGADTS
jgi:6,7-dimethyl-8-ribityllumazine synthase